MSDIGHLIRKNKLTANSSFTFSGHGPHEELQPPQNLLEGQHNGT